MGVDVEGESDACVTEPFAHHLWVLTSRKEQGRARVTQVINPKVIGQSGSFQNGLEVTSRDIDLVERMAS